MGAALLFDASPARLAAGGAARLLGARAVLRARGPARLAEVPAPVPPGPGWERLTPLAAGICGSDLAEVALQADSDNPLSALVSFPHVMGHEVVVRREGAGPGDPAAVVDPWLGCAVRDRPPCPACQAGSPPLCALAGDPVGAHGRGMHLGNVAGLPGGFSAAMVAHRTRLHDLPAGVDPALGVLADPLAVGAHAVDRLGDLDAGPVLVIGAGTIGLAAVDALRSQRPDLEVLVAARWPHSAARAAALGAVPAGTAPDALLEAVRVRSGARVRRPWRGAAWLSGGGAAAVVDAVGSAATLGTALRLVAPRGRIVTVGVNRSRRVESTLLYYKEATVSGSNGYGGGGIAGAVRRLDSAPERYAAWLTHRLTLSRWREAFGTALDPGRTGAVKVVLHPEGAAA